MKIYIYPSYTPSRDKSGNLYIKLFHDSFKKNEKCQVVNRLWFLGIVSLLFNLDADVFIVQWVDLIPQKKFGKIQFGIYIILILLIRILRRKIIWVLHNKRAHSGESKLVFFGMKFIASRANLVVVHSKEGVHFFNERFPKSVGRCVYIPHPVYSDKVFDSSENKYDFIIWGNISKRKNIVEFLTYSSKSSFFAQKKILICGFCGDAEYDLKVRNLVFDQPNVTYINKFMSDEELAHYISQSGCILFTYCPDSVLSSGALIYSINFCKPMIGPNVGSFSDLGEMVKVYNDFAEIPNLKMTVNVENNKLYIRDNSWSVFSCKLLSLLPELRS